jgi:flagellar biosynthesis GTPase FlhF
MSSALCKIQRLEVAGKTRCQFSPLKTHFNLFFDQKHHKYLDKSINDLKKKQKKLKNVKSTCLQKHSHGQICLFGQVEGKKNT